MFCQINIYLSNQVPSDVRDVWLPGGNSVWIVHHTFAPQNWTMYCDLDQTTYKVSAIMDHAIS